MIVLKEKPCHKCLSAFKNINSFKSLYLCIVIATEALLALEPRAT